MVAKCFCLDWFAGPSAQVELFSPGSRHANTYQLKYTPPFRAAIRPPMEERHLGPGELSPVNTELDRLVATLDARAAVSGTSAAAPAPANSAALQEMTLLGGLLLDLMIPEYVKPDLRGERLFLEIGVDKDLLDFPWELMHDGDDFLCLKHAVGRFVNGVPSGIPGSKRPVSRFGTKLDTLSILIISVPHPQDRDGRKYENLPQAEKETQAICDSLGNVENVKLETLIGKEATYNAVYLALKHEHQIVHFNGHAHLDSKQPHLSGLVLFDKDITTGPIANFLTKQPPILCFVNACETAKTGGVQGWKNRHNIFGLAQAFLSTDAYLLGTRWKINDEAAAEFASKFYLSLLVDRKPLGLSVREARAACKSKSPDDEFAWASYVFYGDPRVCFACR
jgi:CHAT domain-containing protein